MSQSLLSPTAIAKEMLRILHNNLKMAAYVNRQYDKTFANSGATMSGKIGPSLRVRKPNRFQIRKGPAVQIQDVSEDYVTVDCSQQAGVDMRFSSADLTLTIDEFSERYIRPAALRIASEIDYEGCNLYNGVYNLTGVAGTNPGGATSGDAKAPDIFLNAGAYLTNYAVPNEDRVVVMNPFGMASSVAGLSGLLNPQTELSKQYKTGAMASSLGFDFQVDQNINRHTCGSRVAAATVQVDGPNQTGSSLLCKTASTYTFTKGDVFYFSSGTAVNTLNWETKHDTGTVQKFVVTAANQAAGGAVTLAIEPAITLTGATATVTASPDDSATITFIGNASTNQAQNLAFHKDAFALVTADLELPRGLDFAAREVYDGISLRILRQYDVNNDNLITRIDVLYGWKILYPQLACRIIGA